MVEGSYCYLEPNRYRKLSDVISTLCFFLLVDLVRVVSGKERFFGLFLVGGVGEGFGCLHRVLVVVRWGRLVALPDGAALSMLGGRLFFCFCGDGCGCCLWLLSSVVANCMSG